MGINTLIYSDLNTPIYKDSKNKVLDWDDVEIYIYYCRADGRVYSRLVKI